MKIAILGTRGIPNKYGGFEQFAQYLSVGLLDYNFEVTVYNPHNHDYKESDFEGVQIVYAYDPEYRLGTTGQFIYDFNCIRHIRKQNYDVVLQLGYTSSSVWSKLLPRKKCVIVTNMDGLEWKRSKFSKRVQRFLKYAEKLAIKNSDLLVADSIGIQRYLLEKYYVESTYIPYGANEFTNPNEESIHELGLIKHAYNMLIARLEPENNIYEILKGSCLSDKKMPFIVVGKLETKYSQFLVKEFEDESHIRFLGGIYDKEVLDNLRYFSNIYFHGHSVGGTNPSLLEAMAASALVCSHDNEFNGAILGEDGVYFNTKEDVADIISRMERSQYETNITNNLIKIRSIYSWDAIIAAYKLAFEETVASKTT